MEKKRTVLIISFHYLPEVMAASFRVYSWAKYLPRFGWNPIILTSFDKASEKSAFKADSSSNSGKVGEGHCPVVHRAPYRQKFEGVWRLRARLSHKENPSPIHVGIRRALNLVIGNLLMLPDERYDWFHSALTAGISVVKRHGVHCIISTGAPWTDLRVAYRLNRITGIPWIADYRDPWSQPTTLGFHKEYIIRSPINRFLERRITKSASALIHISEPLRHGLARMLNRHVYLIPNGYDPENFEKLRTCEPDGKVFTLSFIGTLHNNTTTAIFMEGFHRFVGDEKVSPTECRVEFIGDTKGHLRIAREYEKFSKIDSFFAFKPSMSQFDANEKMCRSHVLLSFPLDMEGCFPAKTFEYLASGRPVLVSPDGRYRGVIRDVLARTGGGVILNSPAEVAEWFSSKYKEFLRTGYVESDTDREAVREYSRERQVHFLAGILDKVSAESSWSR